MSPRHAFPYLSLLLLVPMTLVLAPADRGRALQEAEVARIRAHIARAERLVRDRDVTSLTAVQRTARERNLARLERYRGQGVFPRNQDFPAQRVPYFVDRLGTPCAMAYLIEQSGRRDLVAQVVWRMNNATVTQMAADAVLGPALAAWLGGAGLSVQEAQAIQPSYDGDLFPRAPNERKVSPAYAAASASVGTLNLVSIGLNAGLARSRPSPWLARAGLVTGFVGVGLGAVHLGRDPHSAALGWANLVIGSMSAATSASSLVRSAESENKGKPLAVGKRIYPFC